MSYTSANGNVPPTGRAWFDMPGMALSFLRWFLALFSGGQKLWPVDVVVTSPLPANTYANGTAGVGATITITALGAFPTYDGVTPFKGMKVLLTNEALGVAHPEYNGYYDLTTLGNATTAAVLTRSTSFDQSAEMLQGTLFGVKTGTLHAGKVWEYTGPSSAPTVGSTALIFAGTVKRSLFRGSIPSSRIPFSANPANTDPMAIGATNIQFLTTLIAATTYAQVKRGASAALTLANLIAYINNDTTNTNWVESTTPPTWTLIADAVTATKLRIRKALVRGGKPVPGTVASTVLSATITAGASAWDNANLSAYGVADTDVQQGRAKITITTAMITAGTVAIEFPFTPTSFIVQARSSAGVALAYSDVTAISGDAVVVTLGGGGAPNLVNTDVLHIIAFA